MTANKLQWKRIAKGNILPCDSLLMKKDGTMISVVSGAGVKVGQDAYYLPVEELKSFPKEESDDERIRKKVIATIHLYYGEPLEDEAKEMIAWLEKQGEHANFLNKIQIGDRVTRNEDGVLINLSQLNRVAKKDEKQGEQKPAAWKPSDKQMTALRRMKAAVGGEGEIYEPLNSLYEDLKKLREE